MEIILLFVVIIGVSWAVAYGIEWASTKRTWSEYGRKDALTGLDWEPVSTWMPYAIHYNRARAQEEERMKAEGIEPYYQRYYR